MKNPDLRKVGERKRVKHKPPPKTHPWRAFNNMRHENRDQWNEYVKAKTALLRRSTEEKMK